MRQQGRKPPPKAVTEKYLREEAQLMEYQSGRTFNDGGGWHTWFYRERETGRYYRVHQPTDYRSSYSIKEVKPVTVEYRSWEDA